MAASQRKRDKKRAAPASSEGPGSGPQVRLPWERHRCSIDFDPEECKTHQSFKDECDVNKIIDMHVRTGIVTHLNRGTPQYGDAPESDIFDAAVAQAEIRSALEQGYEPPEAPEEPIEPDTGSDTQTPETASQEASEDSSQPTEG